MLSFTESVDSNSQKSLPEKLDFFVERLDIDFQKSGDLNGLRFGVKSIIAVKGHRQRFGNLIWDEINSANKATNYAPCVKRLLKAGATLTGILQTSEFAFNLTGYNCYGLPANPKVLGAVPGGSSSGSAGAVAANLLDFALGTDTGGSIRIPAAYCGVWSLKPSRDLISTEGILPVGTLYDTVGIMAKNATILTKVAAALIPDSTNSTVNTIYIVKEAFDLCSKNVKEYYQNVIDQFASSYLIKEISMDEITQETNPQFKGLNGWRDAAVLLLENTWQTLSPWLIRNIPNWKDLDSKLTAEVRANFIASEKVYLDLHHNPTIKTKIEERVCSYRESVNYFLANNACLFIPTVPFTAPMINQSLSKNEFNDIVVLTSIASLLGVPQVQMPIVNDELGCLLGLSLIGKQCNDQALLSVAMNIESLSFPQFQNNLLHSP